MKTLNQTEHKAARWMRWMARLISALTAGFWLLILLDILVCDAIAGFVCLNWETAILAGMVITSMLSVLVAWWRAKLGGIVMILWGLAFTMIAYLTSRPYEVTSMLVTGVPFLIAGFLFLASGWSSRAIPMNNASSI
jgi:hypothetical protein